MIPDFNEHGFLPVGGHNCTWEEFYEKFRINEDRRVLCATLEEVVATARRCGFLKVLIGGSFPTSKERPHDIDLVWVTDVDVTKDTVKPECVHLMEDRLADERYGWSMQYVPVDHDQERIQYWAAQFGWCSQTQRPRGMLVLDL